MGYDSSNVPRTVTVELTYSYMDEPISYEFPRLRKRDAEIDEQERLFGGGKKMKPSERLAAMVTNIRGWSDFDPRGEGETDIQFRGRVLAFFKREEMEEYAEDALLYRVSAVFPQATFRRGTDSGLAVDILRSASAGPGPVVSLSNLSTPGTGPTSRMSGVPIDTGPEQTEAANKG